MELRCTSNAMQLNADKCQVMPFKFYPHCSMQDELTVVKDFDLNMKPPLVKVYILLPIICAKANSVLGFLARTSRNTLSSWTIKTLVRPILENMALSSGHLIKLGTATTSTRADAFLGSEKCASWTSLCLAHCSNASGSKAFHGWLGNLILN